MNNDCVDLRPWAKSHRFRYRFEESYYAERPEYRGDGRWFVEVLCRYGMIYPKGGSVLLAYASRGVKSRIAELPGVTHHQYDDDAEVFRFSLELLDEVAAILKPRRKRATGASLEQLKAMRERRKTLVQSEQAAQGTMSSRD
jgi:hypothetical protein